MGIKNRLTKRFLEVQGTFKQQITQVQRELITASSIAVLILLLRAVGLMQWVEWATLDQFFQLRPQESPEERITIVEIDELSLRELKTWPIPDGKVADLLHTIQNHKPRAIGLDIYRDLAVPPGHDKLMEAYKSIPNIVGIELFRSDKKIGVNPPKDLNQNQVGLNNLLLDGDGRVRRSLLFLEAGNKIRSSFALKLVKLYLKEEGITLKRSKNNKEYLKLGQAIFPRFQSYDGGYAETDDRGYQFLSNFPKLGCRNSSKTSTDSCGFQKISMRDVLAKRIPENLIKNRIVLIGSTATSLQDFVLIPYSSQFMRSAEPVAGIELQAYFISEMLRAALEGRPLMQVWPDRVEALWIFLWSHIGAFIIWQIRPINKSIIFFILTSFILVGSTYTAFLWGWWIPAVPAILALFTSAIAITFQIAQVEEELKRSKEFLHQIINTIADPVFVKNEKRQLIICNEAYCRFIGYPTKLLLSHSDYEFFPQYQADVFQKQDELVLQTQQAKENEEELTDASGKTYYIATKRSLHKDACGNRFLVGVIRDITERKLVEKELKRTADELMITNNELKLKEDNLRYLAYHDPLTGLPNRKYFAEKLNESLYWAKSNNILLGLLFIDLDGFKKVNDTLGHEMGDLLLVTVSQRLSNCLRGSDTVARLGGDEFTVILRTIPNIKVASIIAEKILFSLSQPIVLDDSVASISASIGISIYPINSYDTESLVRQADTAMYRAKHLGKNRYEFS
jgi:diguanylate cyclase (GGDEF)-like protein/PAS domain S-box-containing protein